MTLSRDVAQNWRRPKFYDNMLSPTLKQAVEAQLNEDADEQTSLFEELAIMRVYAGRFVALYSKAVETGEEAKIMFAGEAMREALEAVAQLCEKAHKIREKEKERFSIHDVSQIVDQIVAIHHEAASSYQDKYEGRMDEADYREMAVLFERMVAEQLVIQSEKQQGTLLHPDETATAFDSTVPRLTDETAINDALVDKMKEEGSAKDAMTMRGPDED